MQIPFLDLKRQYLSIKNEIDPAISEVVESHQFIGGEVVSEFENNFARAHQKKHCIGVGNATDALFIILKALEIGRNDEVIIPAHGWLSAAEMVALTGAKPIFVDVETNRFGITPEALASKITSRTKAIIPIHLYGQICEVEALAAICKKYNLHLIEDAAQAHFSRKNGKPAGHWGIATAFSFYPSKILGAFGDGGAILTDGNELAEKCRSISNHGGLSKNDHQFKGINSRLDTFQAAVLNIKLNYAGRWIEERNRIAQKYSIAFGEIDGLKCPEVTDSEIHNFHIYCIRTGQRDALKKHLHQAGIATEIHYPMASPFIPAFSEGHKGEDFPISLALQNSVLSLPIYPELTTTEIDYIISKVKSFYQS